MWLLRCLYWLRLVVYGVAGCCAGSCFITICLGFWIVACRLGCYFSWVVLVLGIVGGLFIYFGWFDDCASCWLVWLSTRWSWFSFGFYC